MGFSENLKTIRESKHMTQAELAEKLGVRRQTIGDWENTKKIVRPRFYELVSLRDALDVSWNKLMADADEGIKAAHPSWNKLEGMVDALKIFAQATSRIAAQVGEKSQEDSK